MDTDIDFYICPICFQVCETEKECHQHQMVACNTGKIGDERRKPLTDRQGKLISRAPKWYFEAVGWKRVE